MSSRNMGECHGSGWLKWASMGVIFVACGAMIYQEHVTRHSQRLTSSGQEGVRCARHGASKVDKASSAAKGSFSVVSVSNPVFSLSALTLGGGVVYLFPVYGALGVVFLIACFTVHKIADGGRPGRRHHHKYKSRQKNHHRGYFSYTHLNPETKLQRRSSDL